MSPLGPGNPKTGELVQIAFGTSAYNSFALSWPKPMSWKSSGPSRNSVIRLPSIVGDRWSASKVNNRPCWLFSRREAHRPLMGGVVHR